MDIPAHTETPTQNSPEDNTPTRLGLYVYSDGTHMYITSALNDNVELREKRDKVITAENIFSQKLDRFSIPHQTRRSSFPDTTIPDILPDPAIIGPICSSIRFRHYRYPERCAWLASALQREYPTEDKPGEYYQPASPGSILARTTTMLAENLVQEFVFPAIFVSDQSVIWLKFEGRSSSVGKMLREIAHESRDEIIRVLSFGDLFKPNMDFSRNSLYVTLEKSKPPYISDPSQQVYLRQEAAEMIPLQLSVHSQLVSAPTHIARWVIRDLIQGTLEGRTFRSPIAHTIPSENP